MTANTLSPAAYWFKVVDYLQQNWAVVQGPTPLTTCTVFFIADTSRVFDEMGFASIDEAAEALRRNGFRLFHEDKDAMKFISPPQPPFTAGEHPNGRIYSSGKHWIEA